MKLATDLSLPDGFGYKPSLLSIGEEAALVERLTELPLREFEFHGYVGKRRVVSFGWHYDFSGRDLRQVEEIPAFLLPVRDSAVDLAGMPASDLRHVLVTEYRPGAAIGWHKDKAVFGDVTGILLLATCTFRFRRRAASGWDRVSFTAEPRSAYVLRGAVRNDWEHSISGVESLRYSITFRTLSPG